MRVIRYLAYGSNLLPARLGARLGRIRSLGAIALPGWGLRFHKNGADGSGKCDLIEAPDETAWGAVWEISLADRDRLDRIEGVGNGYHACSLANPEFGELHVYRAEKTHIDPGLVPFDWYHEFVIAGARHHDFPTAYIARIGRVVSVRDHDDERRTSNLAILRAS